MKVLIELCEFLSPYSLFPCTESIVFDVLWSYLCQVKGATQVIPRQRTTFSQSQLFATAPQSLAHSPESRRQTRPLALRTHTAQLLPVTVTILSTWVKVTTEKVEVKQVGVSHDGVHVVIYNRIDIVDCWNWLISIS